jgi:putative transposase
VSRKTGYKWLERYQREGLDGLADRRQAPGHCPRTTPAPIAEALLEARRRHPTWGPRKLLAYLARRQPRVPWPAPSTVGALLRTNGLVPPRRRRPHGHPGRPSTPMDAPNAV